MLAKIDHPNIIRIIDFGNEDTAHYYIMEYVKGEDLSRYIKRVGVLSEAQALHVLWNMAKALQCLEQQNIVHRDIKPSNIVLGEDGRIKLCDLGLAKQDQEQDITRTGAVMGTPHFMSPEQIEASGSIDIRSDIYSLGATFYYMLSGLPPYDGNFSSIAYQHVHKNVPQLQRKDISKFARQLLQKMMTKDINKRLANPKALLNIIKSSKLDYQSISFSVDASLTNVPVEPHTTIASSSTVKLEEPHLLTPAEPLSPHKKSRAKTLLLASAVISSFFILVFPPLAFFLCYPLCVFVYLYPKKFELCRMKTASVNTQFFVGSAILTFFSVMLMLFLEENDLLGHIFVALFISLGRATGWSAVLKKYHFSLKQLILLDAVFLSVFTMNPLTILAFTPCVSIPFILHQNELPRKPENNSWKKYVFSFLIMLFFMILFCIPILN